MKPRAIGAAVMAMARPARPAAEAQAVRAVAASMPGSARSAAASIAAAVVADCVAWLDVDPADELTASLAALAELAKPTPIALLARCPDFDTASLVMKIRTERFQARCGRPLSDAQRRIETAELTAEVTATLTRRYRALLAGN